MKLCKNLLIVGLILILIQAGFAMPIQIQSQGVKQYSASLSQASPGNLSCASHVRLYSGYRANLTMVLQRNNNGIWEDITFWEQSGEGILGAVLNTSYSVSL